MAVLSNFFANIRFDEFIYALYQGGWYQFVFPFMLVYAIVFTILNKVDLFEEKKSVKVIIALVFALFAIAFPITGDAQSCGISVSTYSNYGCETLGDLMMTLFPGVTAFSIGILSLYIIAAMLGVDLMKFFVDNKKDNFIRYILVALGVFVVVYYYARGFGWLGFNSSSTWWVLDLFKDPLLYILIIFGLFFFWVTKDDETSSKKPSKITRSEEFKE